MSKSPSTVDGEGLSSIDDDCAAIDGQSTGDGGTGAVVGERTTAGDGQCFAGVHHDGTVVRQGAGNGVAGAVVVECTAVVDGQGCGTNQRELAIVRERPEYGGAATLGGHEIAAAIDGQGSATVHLEGAYNLYLTG